VGVGGKGNEGVAANVQRVKDGFIELNSKLKNFKPWRHFSNTAPNNSKLLASANRVNTPNVFKAFVNIIERKTNFKFNDIPITKEDVIASDNMATSEYNKKNFDYSRLNVDRLCLAAQIATEELGLSAVGLDLMDLDLCPGTFPGSSSSCFPDYKKKNDPQAQQNAISFARDYLSTSPDKALFKLFTQPSTIFHRFQYKVGLDGELVKKIRPIWGIPFTISTLEAYFFRSLVDRVPTALIDSGSTVTSLGRDLPSISRDIISKFRGYKTKLISLDLKAFDSRVPSFMWSLFFAAIRQCIRFDLKYSQHFENLMYYYCYTPYVYRSRSISYQRRGTPSGCLITALFNTWVNRVIINYGYLEKSGDSLTPHQRLCVLGDDNLLTLDFLTESYIIKLYQRFGMLVNVEKTDVVNSSDTLPFLGYLWDNRDRPTQTENWYITHLAIPSTFYTGLEVPVSLFQTYRAISVCLPLYNGYKMFMKLIGYDDFMYRRLHKMYLKGEDPIIPYVTKDRRFENIKFPMSLFVRGSWEEKSLLVSSEQD